MGSLAGKKSFVPTAIGSNQDSTAEAAPGRMSFTSTVPASVPSVFHSSRPTVPSLAQKKTWRPSA